ncbi:apolipoprotein N-acyltransferase [Aurantimicrobium minutum]|uniref:apolipoprotein N-acyltransferase n=1 Tax=Aurantimicrobium minutum TaxID=708131 RepID=UPI002473E8D5|nr:apolipoprotein N-acyltransferase [Aurantimicrobium minutum]MDH6409131.1 apolipoprotein N-acyltransferase [Aurantimicrobium minutum]
MKRLNFWFALILAVVAGFALQGAFPATNFWPFAFVGVFLLLWSLLGRSFWTAFIVGSSAGASFWLSLINWLTLYLGPVPWLALGILQALFFGLGASLISIVINRGPTRWTNKWGRIGLVSIVIASLWTLRESITSVWPYGGFSWGRLAQSQSESPISHVVTWVGTAGLSFCVAVIAAIVFQVLRERHRPLLAYPILAFVVLIAIPGFTIDISGTTNVLAVQGNSKAGLFDHGAPGSILQDHVSGTLPYAGEDIDMVVWPENASDVDPLESELAALTLTTVSKKLGAPIVTGTITTNADDENFNSSLVWTDRVVAQYDKIHPVPFAEYMPNRELWRTFQPELVDLVTRDYSFGTRSNVVDINGVLAGIALCFDITDDQQAYQLIDGGAQLILAQTNNADFGKTSENLQQLAIARLRAIETGRSVVNISTVGTSEIISPTGETISSIPAYQPGEMLSAVPLSSTITPAMAFGRTIEWTIGAVGVVGLSLILIRRKP